MVAMVDLLSAEQPDDDYESPALSAAAQYGVDFVRETLAGKKLLVLSGAGLSTDSGIPDYRGEGRVARHPMTFDNFMGSHEAQVRYWARSFVGWSRIAMAKPNPGHFAIARAESLGQVSRIITQNVDGLHQAAGARKVIELHGTLGLVRCLKCGQSMPRTVMDALLTDLNPSISKSDTFEFSPDGDAEVDIAPNFQVPACPKCGGVLKPDVVFFGENVPADRVNDSMAALDAADALLVVGTSLAVNSGMRFAKRAAQSDKPIVIVNLGPTKADELALAKIEANTSLVLERLLID
jgi:NAD-dependent SIR2 family protein deacetylase